MLWRELVGHDISVDVIGFIVVVQHDPVSHLVLVCNRDTREVDRGFLSLGLMKPMLDARVTEKRFFTMAGGNYKRDAR